MGQISGPLAIEVDGEVFLTPISPTFGRVDEEFIRRTFRDRAGTLADILSLLIRGRIEGTIEHRTFIRRAMRALQQAYYTIFSLGALSVDPFHVLTDYDIRVIQNELLGEQRFLRSFSRELRRGLFDLAPETRARLYLAALRGVFELGRVSALPAGPYEWILGDTDHCNPCADAALNGPYKRDSTSLMSLPVVPGIPGSGEVCQGLTRCGCTLRLRGFPANEQLQLQLRDILYSITLEI
ncbi:MAG TPA: hypothetical protein VFK94_03620 [Patescibacteria group bacterium]|nr:hypothetical protein [Patescibacteria group bacterium]